MARTPLCLGLWMVAAGAALADLSFVFNSPNDVPVTAAGYSASGPLDLTLQFQPVPGRNLTVVRNTGPAFISGTFEDVPQGAVVPLSFNGVTCHYIANYHGANGRSLVLQWPELQLTGWGGDLALQGSATTGFGASPSLLANEGGLAGKVVIATSISNDHALALTADGEVFAWGNNSYGQLGDGTSQATRIPVQVDDSGALAGKAVVAIAAGSLHSLALTADGEVFAWGDNGSGRLGDGTTETRHVPVAVDRTGALAGKSVVAIAAGQYHSLALASDGRVYSWGYGFQGQLGDGTIDNRISPVAVETSGVLAGKSVIGISAGFYHSVAAASDGTVATWGFNTNGQLGNNSTSPSPVPVLATGSLAGKSVTALRAGANFNLALTHDGQVHAWGSNGSGQLGIGSTADTRIPTLAGGSLAGKTVTAIAAGDAHGTALTSDGQPHVWGSDGNGQLGNGVGPETSAPSPVPVPGLGPASGKTVAALFAGGGRSHALADPGAPRRRVDPLNLTANPEATARFTATVSHPFPTSVRWQISASGTGGPFQDITDEPSAGTGTLTLGEIGAIPHGAAFRAVFKSLSGSVISHPAVLSKIEWPATFAAASGPLATVTSASVAGNLAPVLGFEPTPGTDLTLIRNNGPAPITGRFANIPQGATVPLTFNGVTYRFVANYHGGNGRSLVLQWPSMGLFGWGRGDSGLFGSLGSSQTLPVEIPITGAMAGKTITGISHSGGHALALTADGRVFAWGGNSSGQLGSGSTTDSSEPVAVEGGALAGKSVVALSAGDHHSLAVTTEGRVVIWGRLRSGFGSNPSSLLPVELSPGGPLASQAVVAISAGGTFDLALTASGEIFGWGENSFGQLGSYNTQYQPDPVLIGRGEIGSRVVTAIAAGSNHALALTEDGAVFSWGSDQYGSLGIGNGTPGFLNPLPVRVGASGALAGKKASVIAAVSSRGMVLADDGQVYGWGINWNGELGNGGTASGLVPEAVDTSGALAGKFVTTLACGSSHTAVLTRDGAIFAWGDNGNGELGYPGWEDRLVPVEVTTSAMAGATPTALGAGWDSNLALVGRGAPAITRHPMDFMAAAGRTATFTATATDPFPFVVKWQVSPTGAAGPFGDIAGDADTLTVPGITAAQDGWAYRAVFVSDAGQRVTEPAVLKVVEWSATLSSAAAVPFESMRVLASGSLDLDLGFAPAPGVNLTLVKNSGPEFIAGAFDNIPQGGLVTLTHGGASYPFFANYFGGNGRSLVLQWPWTAVAGWGQSLGTSPVAVGTRPALAEETLVALRGGPGHQLALTADGQVFGWGSGGQGQLGNGGTASSQVPVKATGALAGKPLVAIAAGDNFSLGLSAAGEVFSWGFNFDGQLGDGSTGGSRTEPVAVFADGALAGKTVTAIAAGADHGLALTSDGEVFAWGDNSRDQLGIEDWHDSAVPVAVDPRGALSGETVVAIAAGEYHSLALTADGEVIGWGQNTGGKLGNGSTTDPGVPVKVDATGALAGKRVVAIAAGAHHSAALTSDGRVFTWGSNFDGQLGSHEAPDGSAVPVAVASDGAWGGRSVASISASGSHCLAVTADGEVFSWGLNSSGQLGDGGVVTRPAPVAIGSTGALAAASVQGIAAADNRSFALLGVAGSPFVITVPRGRSFLLGAGAAAPAADFTAAALDPLPLSVRWQEAGPAGEFSDIAGNPSAGTATLQLSGLTIAADGHRYRAVFSNAGGSTATPPATLGIGSAASTVTLATATSVPFTAESPVLDGTLDVTLGFAPVPGAELTLVRNTGASFLSGGFTNLVQGAVVQLSHGGVHHAFEIDYFGGNGRSLVLRWATTLAAAWGNGSSGQVGAGTSTATNRTPVAVVANGTLSGQTLAKIAAGTGHSLALASSGRVFAWGANQAGQLGNGTTAASNLPVEVDASGVLAGKRVIAIAAGSAHSLALTADGQLAAWGSDSNGQLGNGALSGSTTAVTVTRDTVLAGKSVTAIAAGPLHNVALASDGTLVAWGSNQYGQLGNGTTTTAQSPVAVVAHGALAGKTVIAIAAGGRHTLALTADGRVFSWGSNQAGQLGNGSGNPAAITSPAAISGGGLIAGKTVVAIAAGDSHSLALTSDGTAYAWGLGSQGQLGTGFTSASYAPAAVQTSGPLAGKSLVAIAAGGSHSLAIDSAGLGYAWGSNDYGQLGTTNVRPTLSPEAMSTQGALGSRPLMAIAAGLSHSLALAGRGEAPVVTESPLSQTLAAGGTVILTAAAEGYPAPTVRWQRSTTGPGGTFSNLAGQTTATLELVNVTPSQTGYAYRAVFTNLEASTNSAAASLTVQPTFENFLVSRGLPADTPPTDDPFHTGIPLLLAFAFDLSPSAPDRTKLPAVSFVGGKLRVSYTRWKNASDLHHSVEVSHGLDHWISGPDVTEVISVTPLGNTRETVVEQEILADPSPAGFVRVRVDLDSP